MDSSDPIRIPLRNVKGEVVAHAVVDAIGSEGITPYRWSLSSEGYAVRTVTEDGKKRGLRMHREVMSLSRGDGLEVDHKNRDRLDNRRENLRVLTHVDNPQNCKSHADSTSKYRGVCWYRPGSCWKAYAQVQGTHHHLGYFSDEDDAAKVAADFRAAHMPYSEEAAA